MDIGSELRRARLARRLSLDDIARTTKISPAVLRSLENNAFHNVPGGLFTRGYLRAYATNVGLAPEPIVAAYRETFNPPLAAVPEADSRGKNSRHTDADPHWTVEESEASSRHSEILQFAVILIVAFVYLASLRHSKTASDLGTAEAAGLPVATAAVTAQPEPQAVGTSGTVDTVKPLSIEIHPSGECWVDVTVDGTHVASRLMNAGDRQSFTVRDDLTMRIGDPAAFAFSIDGAAGRTLGEAGHAVTVRLNRANYRTLLAGTIGG